MIGLGLVVLILAILVLGTFNGLASYQATTKSIDSKLVELKKAQDVKSVMTDLLTTSPPREASLEEQRDFFKPKIELAKNKLAAYRDQLQDTLDRHRDPDKGIKEIIEIQAFSERFTRLDEAFQKVTDSRIDPLEGTPALRDCLG